MSRITKKLENWKQQGLITSAQFDAILSYEDSIPSTNWTLIGVTILAVATLSLGLISLIAYNWHLIPAEVKLASGFATLFALAYAIFHLNKRISNLVKDGLIAFFILFCFVMIGLIAQVYNLSGPIYRTGFFWSAITLAIASFAWHGWVRGFWVLVFLGSLLTACWEMPLIKETNVSPFTLFTLSTGLLCLLSRNFFRHQSMQKTFEAGAMGAAILGCLMFSFEFIYRQDSPNSFAKIAPQLIMAPLIIGFISFDSHFRKSHKILLSLLVILTSLNALMDSFTPSSNVIQSFTSILGFLALGLLFYSTDHRKLFNFMFALVGIKIFEIFLRNTSGLLATGLGLMLAGGITLLAVYGWNKNKNKIESRLQEVLK